MNMQLINNLNQITEQKLKLFKEIQNITILQKKDIEDNNAGNIEALVQKKQEVIDAIDELDKIFLEGYRQLKEELKLDRPDKIDTGKYPELITLRNYVEEIMGLATGIMEMESSNKEKLNDILDEVKSELRRINKGRRSVKAYEAPVIQNDGIFVDKKK